MDAKTIYVLDGQEYEVAISYKRIRNIHFRFDGEKYLVSCPKKVPLSAIKSGLDKYARKLRDRNPKNQAFGDDYVYLFGHKIPVTYPGSISLKDETKITFKDQDDLLKKMRKVFLNYMQARTKAFADSMKCPSYIVKVRQMKSRYGSNNKAKKTITYSLTLIHYSAAIIDSVVVHELAHCFVYNHSDSFYRVVYKYCPEYDKLRKKLIRAEFE